VSLSGRTVLVTGGTGFIGGRLVERLVLEEGCRVRVLVRNFARAPRIAGFPIEMRSGDITDRSEVEAATEGCDVVFHCAYDFVPTLKGQRRTGVEGTTNVAEAALAAGVKRLVHLSTVAVHWPAADGDLVEDSPWPSSEDPYTLVKREAEERVRALHREAGLPVVILRPTLVYGPFSDFWTLTPIQRLRKGQVPLIDGGNGLCNAVYVDDVVDAMILAALRPGVEGEAFLVSADAPISWRTFLTALETAAGVDSLVEMSATEVRKRIQDAERKRRAVHRVGKRLADPRTLERLGGSPLGRLHHLFPAPARRTAHRWLMERYGEPSNGGKAGSRGRRLVLPDENQIALQTSAIHVRIEKARRELGYAPQFDFERGMEATQRFLEWANLSGGDPPRWRRRGPRGR
jgi:nucleoside-diphosphate-sugar epimerase